MNRRTFLAGTTVALSLSAGCVGGNSGSSETTTTASSTTTPSETTTGTTTATKVETAEPRTGDTDTMTATSDVETTSAPEEETQQNSGPACGSNFVEFYGLSAPFADNVWGPNSVSVGFDLGAGKQVELVVLEGDTVLGTKRVEAPADTGFVSDGDIIPLNTELSGEHTIQVVMYPATGEGNQVSPEQAIPCQYEGEPVQTEPRTIDFSRFSKNSKTTTHHTSGKSP